MKKLLIILVLFLLSACSKDNPELPAAIKSCNEGNLQQCHLLATFYQYGTGTKKDIPKAIELYRSACDGGIPASCNVLGIMIMRARLPPDPAFSPPRLDDFSQAFIDRGPKAAMSFYEKACDGGLADGCFNFAEMLFTGGKDVEVDKAKSAQLYATACDGGTAKACAQLARMNEHGDGTVHDMHQALALYEQACNGAVAESCTHLGVHYFKMESAHEAKVKAVSFFQTACENNDAKGCLWLGWAYENNEGVKTDKFKAFDLYKKSCDLRSARGCNNLALMYKAGEATRLDHAKALEYFGKACDMKLEDGCKNFAALKDPGGK
jgi:TPR repeat protein